MRLISIIFVIALIRPARGESATERYLEGLRQRQLFQLAELYCRDRLNNSQLTDNAKTQLTIELSRSYAQHALYSRPELRGPLWKQAADVVSKFERENPQHPRLVLVRVQGSLGLLARGELARQEADVAAGGPARMEAAKKFLRESISSLQSLEQEITRMVRKPSTEKGAMTAAELWSLEKNVQYHLARAFRNQARSYPKGSPDRANALLQAIKYLSPLARQTDDNTLAWRSRIDEVTCHRLLIDFATTEARLRALESLVLPPDHRLRTRAERIRLDLARKQVDNALKSLKMGRELHRQTSAELDLAFVETYVAAWQIASAAKDQRLAAAWQGKAADTVREIERTHGAYWTRRAEMLLAHEASTGGGVGNVDVLVRTARNFYTRKQYDEAIQGFDAAARKALAAKDMEQAYQLFFTAARIEHDRGRWREAVERFRGLAAMMPSHPKASDAHLWAALDASKLAGEGSPNEYSQLLTEHLAKWPRAATADRARWWLGKLRQHEQAWSGAINAYRGIATDFQHYDEAMSRLADCYLRWLAALKAAGQVYDQQASTAIRLFENLVLGDDSRLPERWSPTARLAAVTAAELRLRFTASGHAAAEALLAAALKDANDASPAWRATAQSFLVIALAGQGKRNEALKTLQAISGGSPQRLLELLRSLSDIAANARPDDRAQLAQLQLRTIQLLQAENIQLRDADRLALSKVQASALNAAGRQAEALQLYKKLAESNPRDGEIQEGYASLLMKGTDRPTVELALEKWRDVLRKSPPKTPRWYQAKFSITMLHYRLGDKKRAGDIIRLLKAIPPGLDGTDLKPKFVELLQLCNT